MLFDLSEFGLLSVSGQDAKKLLQGQLTCDMEKISSTQSGFGALCNPQGRIISLFYLIEIQSIYYLLMPQKMIAVTMSALKKYAVFFKTEIQEASDRFLLIGVKDIDANTIQHTALINIPTNASRFILLIDRTNKNEINAESLTNGIAWKNLNISEGIPAIYPETTGKFLPHEINLHKLNAIDFEKGCYTGQEIIARMHYRGKLKNHLYLASISCNAPPSLGNDIYSEEEAHIKSRGLIVDVCHLSNNDYLMLIVTDESNAKNNHLFLNKDNKTYFTFI